MEEEFKAITTTLVQMTEGVVNEKHYEGQRHDKEQLRTDRAWGPGVVEGHGLGCGVESGNCETRGVSVSWSKMVECSYEWYQEGNGDHYGSCDCLGVGKG